MPIETIPRPASAGAAGETEHERLALLGRMAPALAHEVNTLLGIALTSGSLLTERIGQLRASHEAGTLTRAEFEGFLDQAVRAGALLDRNLSRCTELVGAFKQVSVDQNGGPPRRVVLSRLINDTVTSLHPFLRKLDHGLTVDCPEMLSLVTRPGALNRVLINLLLNSVHHAGGGPTGPRLSLELAARQTGNRVILTYSDDGCGIPPELMQHVFEPFVTTRAGRGGSGLGLAIVRGLVEEDLSGSLTLRSTPGQGVVFTLVLPTTLEEV